jgi:hypothetical protein
LGKLRQLWELVLVLVLVLVLELWRVLLECSVRH